MRVKEFSDDFKKRLSEKGNTSYNHLSDYDLVQLVAQKKPELMKKIDRQDLSEVMKQSRAQAITRERQKEFGALSGVSRFTSGYGQSMMDVYQSVKQMFGGNTDAYKDDKSAYMDASKGDFLAGAGEAAGALLATAPIPGLTGAKVASKVASPLAKVVIGLGAGGAMGAGMGATEYVDEGETRATNALKGSLFGAGGAGAGMLIKKVGTKGYNALKGKYANAKYSELLALSKKYDIPFSESDITGKGKAYENNLEGMGPLGMGDFREKGSLKVQSAIGREKAKISPDWDEQIQESLSSKAQSGKAQAKVNYDKVNELSSGNTITPKNAIETASKHETDISNSILGNETNPFSKIKENLSKKDRTFTELRKDRSDISKAAKKASDSGDRNLARQYGEIKEAIENDIEELVNKKAEVGNIQNKNSIGNLDKPQLIKLQNHNDELKHAFHKAQSEYKKNVVPYQKKEIINALKTDTPDEIFNKFIQKDKGDKAKNFYKLLDEKGQKALKDGFLSNAIKGATSGEGTTEFVSPAKLAGYLERMSTPKNAVFKGADLQDINGLAKVMRHAERYGQLHENPSTGLKNAPLLKGGGLMAIGASAMSHPIGTLSGVITASTLTKLSSLMRTKGIKYALASEVGTEVFEKRLAKALAQVPKTTSVIGNELREE